MNPNSNIRIAFMGTPDFAVPALSALLKGGYQVVAVYCQSAKPAGRGHQLKKSAVQVFAEENNLEVRSPKTLRDESEQKYFRDLKLDCAVVAAYGLLLPLAILNAPPKGCINIHASLLPRWRGAAPIHRALLAGDEETGITTMQMEEGLDTGPMLLQEKYSIKSHTTTKILLEELAKMGASLIIQTLEGLFSGSLKPLIQPKEGVLYAAKLSKEDGRLDWDKTAEYLERQLRALSPWPGCYFEWGSEKIKVLKVEAVSNASGKPGTLLDDKMTVACGVGALRLISVQRAGKNPISGVEFLRGQKAESGHIL